MKIKRISVGKIMVIIIAGLFLLYTIEGFGTKSEISSYLEKRCDEPVEVSLDGGLQQNGHPTGGITTHSRMLAPLMRLKI